MPFTRNHDEAAPPKADTAEAWDEAMEAVPFVYDKAGRGKLDAHRIDPRLGAVVDALRSLGATEARIRYDGGNDEGFTYFEAVTLAGATLGVVELVTRLAATDLPDRLMGAPPPPEPAPQKVGLLGRLLRLNPLGPRPLPPTPQFDVPARGAKAEVYSALEWLATEAAVKLLGDGFGTGPYDLYGALTLNLTTGQLTDDPHAERPPDPPGVIPQYPEFEQ